MKIKSIMLILVITSLLVSSLVRAGQDLESYVTRGFKIDYNYGPKGKHHKEYFVGDTLEQTLRACFSNPKTYNDECVRQVAGAFKYQFVRYPSMQGNSCVTTSKASGLTFYGKTPQETVRKCKAEATTSDRECERNLNRGCRACGILYGERQQTYFVFMDPNSDGQDQFELPGSTENHLRILSGIRWQSPCEF